MIKEFRPLTVGGLFDAFLKVLFNRDSMRLLGVYLVLIAAPAGFLMNKLVGLFINTFVPDFARASSPSPDLASTDMLLIGLCVLLLAPVCILYVLMATEVFGKRFFEEPCRLRSSFRNQVKRIPALLLYLLISYGHNMIVSSVTFLFIGLFAAFAAALQEPLAIAVFFIIFFLIAVVVRIGADCFFFGVIPAVAVDRQGLFRSIARSFRFCVKNYLKIVAAMLLFEISMIFGALFLCYACGALFALAAGLLGVQGEKLGALLLHFVLYFLGIFILILPAVVQAFNTVLYCNQKIRHEGLGAELLARRFLEENSDKGTASAGA